MWWKGLIRCKWECKLAQALQRTMWRFLKKLVRCTIQSSNNISRYIPKENENWISVGYLHFHVYNSVSYKNQVRETTQGSINGWMVKNDVVHIHNVIFSHEKGGYPAIGDKMYGPWAHDPKWDKSNGERQYCFMSLTCRIWKSQTYEKNGIKWRLPGNGGW